MGSEWREVCVEDICSSAPNALATGPFGSAISSRYFVDSGVPVIRGSNLSQDVGTRLLDDGLAFITEEKARSFSRSVARRGDLVFTCWGTIDQVGLVDERSRFQEYVVSNKQMKLTPDLDKASSLFLYYLFSSPDMRAQILNQGIGSSVPGFNLGQLRGLSFPLPPLSEQRAIAHILGTLDDKIELNRRMNRTLEEMARAVFKSWFVDFDPVRAKAAVRRQHPRWTNDKVSRAALPNLNPDLAALFPDAFQDSELGEIPMGWEVGTLTNLAAINPEKWTKGSRPAEILYVDLSNTKWGRIEAIAPYSREDAPSRAQQVLRPGDTIVGTVRPGNGSYALVVQEGLTGSTGFAVLRPQNPESVEFVHLAATASDNIERLAHLADGAAYPAVRPEVVGATAVVRPQGHEMRAFSRAVGSHMRRIAESEQASRTLAALRDALLPKLISGELRVKDAERIAARMA